MRWTVPEIDRWGLYLTCVVALFSYAWWKSLPVLPGYSIGMLALVAVIMTVRADKFKSVERVCWVVIGAFLMFAEIRTVRDDRRSQDAQQGVERTTQQERFEGTASSLRQVAAEERKHFDATLNSMEGLDRSEGMRFKELVKKSESLLEHEDELADGLRGRILPGNVPTPENSCEQVPNNGIRVFIGKESEKNVIIVDKFPRVVIARDPKWTNGPSNGVSFAGPNAPVIPIVTLDRNPGGGLDVTLEVRSDDGKLIARMDKRGFVINRNKILEIETPRDKSSLLLVDDSGDEVLNIRYLNPEAIVIGGKVIRMSGIGGSCLQITGSIILPATAR
jgi:hypothetical protein